MIPYQKIENYAEKLKRAYARSSTPNVFSLTIPRSFWICAAATVVSLVVILNVFPVHRPVHTLTENPHRAQETTHANVSSTCSSNNGSCWDTDSKYAYTTLLAGYVNEEHDINDDIYYVAARILVYQLLHAPETRTTHNYSVIVLVSPEVSEAKKERLRKDGALVWEREVLSIGWGSNIPARYQACWSKLHLWELTQFERIAFFDADTILTNSMDNLFEDPAILIPQTTRQKEEAVREDEADLPPEYVFAAMQEMRAEHDFPPTEEHHDWYNWEYFNGGFFVVKPGLDILNYYKSVLSIPFRFNPDFAEQNLLNYAHRPNGNMPWTPVNPIYNLHSANLNDLEHGVQSLHSKFNDPGDEKLLPQHQRWRGRMEGFYEAWDLGMSQ